MLLVLQEDTNSDLSGKENLEREPVNTRNPKYQLFKKCIFSTLFFFSNNAAVIIKCVIEDATNETHTGTKLWSVRLPSAPTKAKIKATNKQFPYLHFSLLTTVGSLETNFK